MNKITKKLLACAIVCAGCSTQAIAQGWTPAGMEWLKEQRLWFQSQNAAGTVFDNTDNYSDVKLNYQRTGGNFARPQEGADEQTIGVSSEGFLNLDDAYVWGAFSFRQENKWDAGYNASITDPFRGMPYYVADKYLSDWRNQYYDLSFRAATPLYWNRVAFGIERGHPLLQFGAETRRDLRHQPTPPSGRKLHICLHQGRLAHEQQRLLH